MQAIIPPMYRGAVQSLAVGKLAPQNGFIFFQRCGTEAVSVYLNFSVYFSLAFNDV